MAPRRCSHGCQPKSSEGACRGEGKRVGKHYGDERFLLMASVGVGTASSVPPWEQESGGSSARQRQNSGEQGGSGRAWKLKWVEGKRF